LQLSVRGKNKKEKLETFLRSFSKTTDEILLGSTQKDVDEFFDKEKNFLLDYHSLLKDATLRADKMTKAHKGMAVCVQEPSIEFYDIGNGILF
jgi:sorting nexin-5/6/32